jgi:hypothetical protein
VSQALAHPTWKADAQLDDAQEGFEAQEDSAPERTSTLQELERQLKNVKGVKRAATAAQCSCCCHKCALCCSCHTQRAQNPHTKGLATEEHLQNQACWTAAQSSSGARGTMLADLQANNQAGVLAVCCAWTVVLASTLILLLLDIVFVADLPGLGADLSTRLAQACNTPMQ